MKQKLRHSKQMLKGRRKRKKKKKEDHIEIFRKQRGGGVPVIEKQLHIVHYTAILIFFTDFRNRRKVLTTYFFGITSLLSLPTSLGVSYFWKRSLHINLPLPLTLAWSRPGTSVSPLCDSVFKNSANQVLNHEYFQLKVAKESSSKTNQSSIG